MNDIEANGMWDDEADFQDDAEEMISDQNDMKRSVQGSAEMEEEGVGGLSSAQDENEPTQINDIDLEAYFPPLDGTALFTVICCMNHSCTPNVEVLWDDTSKPLQAVVRSLKDIKRGEELCFSYIDTELSYIDRKNKLRDYGFACDCEKCIAQV